MVKTKNKPLNYFVVQDVETEEFLYNTGTDDWGPQHLLTQDIFEAEKFTSRSKALSAANDWVKDGIVNNTLKILPIKVYIKIEY